MSLKYLVKYLSLETQNRKQGNLKNALSKSLPDMSALVEELFGAFRIS